MEDIEDSTNLIGISKLINVHHINSNLNLDAIEKSIIGSTKIRSVPENDPAKEFKNTIRELSIDTGINLDEGEDNDSKKESESESGSGSAGSESASRSNSSSSSNSSRSASKSGSSSSSSQSSSSESESESSAHKHRSSHRSDNNRHIHLDKALNTYSGNNDTNLELENEEDMKTILLEDIDTLKEELEQDQVDITRIPNLDRKSDIDEVRKIHKMLRMKYDRKRCNSFGTEIILASAQGLEYLFDGKKKWGPYNPDLTGWSNTIRPKLRRMKYETSTIVANIMQAYNIGPMARVGLELIPSAILYSRMRREQHGKSNYSPDQMSNAFEDLRAFDN